MKLIKCQLYEETDQAEIEKLKCIELSLLLREANYTQSIELSTSYIKNNDFEDPYVNFNFYLFRARSFYFLGQPQSGLDCVNEIEEKLDNDYKEIEMIVERIRLNNVKGNLLWLIGDLDDAIDCYRDCLKRAERVYDEIEICNSLNNIGFILLKQNNLNEALTYINRAIKIAMRRHDFEQILRAQNNQFMIYYTKGQMGLAKNLAKENYDLTRTYGNKLELAMANHNLGTLYWFNDNHRKAKIYYDRALGFLFEVGNEIFTSRTLYSLIMLSISFNDMKNAEKYLRVLEKTNNERENSLILMRYQLAKAVCLINSDRLSQKAKSLPILERITKETSVDQALTVQAIINMISLQILELQIEDNQTLFKKIQKQIIKLQDIADQSNSQKLTIDLEIIKSKLGFINGEVPTAMRHLGLALQISQNNNLITTSLTISKEIEKLKHKISRIKALGDHDIINNQFMENQKDILSYLTTLSKDNMLKEYLE